MTAGRPVVCCIGTTEPWNAAGLGLQVLALNACGASAVTVVAGVSAQDRAGLHAVAAIAAELVRAQLASLATAGIAAYQIGALVDVATIDAVVAHLSHANAAVPGRATLPVVYDPVLAASGGGSFASDAVRRAIIERMLPLATVVTPNLAEAASLTGDRVDDLPSMERAGRALVARGARAALVKGGHLPDRAIDLLVDANGVERFEARRLPGDLRGTGCLLATALAADLARGRPLSEAIERARRFVRERFETAAERGGMRIAF